MIQNRKIILILSTILVVAILAITFTSCLKIGLQEKNVLKRIEEEGGTYQTLRTSYNPFTEVTYSDYSMKALYLAKMPIGETIYDVYVLYADDEKSSNWMKEEADTYLSNKKAEEAQLLKDIEEGRKFIENETIYDYEHWITYQYDKCVMLGYYEAVAILRKY